MACRALPFGAASTPRDASQRLELASKRPKLPGVPRQRAYACRPEGIRAHLGRVWATRRGRRMSGRGPSAPAADEAGRGRQGAAEAGRAHAANWGAYAELATARSPLGSQPIDLPAMKHAPAWRQRWRVRRRARHGRAWGGARRPWRWGAAWRPGTRTYGHGGCWAGAASVASEGVCSLRIFSN